MCFNCEHDPCTCWGRVKPADLVRDTTSTPPPPEQWVTRTAFGLDLYETISACARVQQLLRMIAAEVLRKKDTTDLSAEYKRQKEYAKHLATSPTLHDETVTRLMREYPWLNT